MQVAAKPLYLTRDQVPPEVVAREQQIFRLFKVYGIDLHLSFE